MAFRELRYDLLVSVIFWTLLLAIQGKYEVNNMNNLARKNLKGEGHFCWNKAFLDPP